MEEINRKPLEHQRIWFCYLKVVVCLKVNLGVMGSQISGVLVYIVATAVDGVVLVELTDSRCSSLLSSYPWI